MRLRIEIDCSNAAFDGNADARGDEVRRILDGLSDKIRRDGLSLSFRSKLFDSNGNNVGSARTVMESNRRRTSGKD